MSLLLTLVILIIIFALVWYAIGIIPFPPPIAGIKWVFYVLLIIVAIIVLIDLTGISLPF